MALVPGSRLGVYEITAQIGEGGMGAVYRATDTSLGRQVAIKVLPDAFAQDADRLARFEREARTLAALNHPNIATIYAVEKSGGTTALVMELVEGPTLADHIARGPIPLDEALPIARQIAEGLEAAHEQGIIHRDLKPANIKVRSDGTVKVLDFGLAKAIEPVASRADVSQSPTITSPAMTRAGIVLGTAAYMAPEQAKGRTVDKRADLWAFGCVLYEMLTGRRPLQPARDADASADSGETVAETLAAVLTQEPNWSLLPAATPVAIRRLLRRCLEKDRKRRMPDAAAARLDIDDALSASDADAAPMASATAPTASNASRASSRALPWTVAAAVSLATIALSVPAVRHVRETSAPPSVVRLTATPAGEAPFAGLATNGSDLAISPDGSRIVYVNTSSAGGPARLFVRSLNELEAKPLFPVATGFQAGFSSPFISADGATVGYWDNVGVLRKIPIDGGVPIVLLNGQTSQRGASWGDDGAIVFATTGSSTGLLRVASTGGEPEVLTKPDETKGEGDHILPDVLPGSRAVLFTVAPLSPDKAPSIAALDLETREQKVLVVGGSHPHYVASGYLLYIADDTIRAVRFDPVRLEVTGTPAPILQGVMTKSYGFNARAVFNAAVSRNGTLAYIAGEAQGALRSVTWVDSSGREEPLGAPVRAYAYARLSPDERRIAFDIRDQQADIWTWDMARKTLTRLTFDPGLNRGIAWTPDSRRLAFSRQLSGGEEVYWQAADGTGSAERLTNGPGIKVPLAISPDGARLLFETPSVAPYDIGMVTLGPEHAVESLLNSPFSEQDSEISPDGHWLAYGSNESGRDEVFVRPYPNVNEGRWQVSTEGGSTPLWSRDGRWLYYWVGVQGSGQGRIMRVSVQRGSNGFASGSPELVVQGPYLRPQAGRAYDVARDGRMLVIKYAPVAPTTPNQLVVVLNWTEELKRLVPTH